MCSFEADICTWQNPTSTQDGATSIASKTVYKTTAEKIYEAKVFKPLDIKQ